MENTNAEPAQPALAARSPFNNRKMLFIALGIAAFLIVAALFVMQGYVVAATVNGSPISRLSVVNELEKRGGKEALNALITEKLIADEARNKNIVIDESELAGEIQTIESQITAMGSTLEDQLQQQGITEQGMRDQLTMHLTLEKLLADKAEVSEEEIDAYIKEQKITVPKESETEARTKIKEQIREDKVNQFADPFIAELQSKANIKYYVNY